MPMTLDQLFYFLTGLFVGVEDVDNLDYDLVTYHLISFAKQFKKIKDDSKLPDIFKDPRFVAKLNDAATNNPDKFDLNWFYFYFKSLI